MSEQEKDPDLKIKLGQNNEIKLKTNTRRFPSPMTSLSP